VTECCDSKTSGGHPAKNACCPVNGKEYGRVGVKTILHHLAEPWSKNVRDQSYYYCTDPNCNVVYFGEDQSVILKSTLRTKIGIKDTSPERSVCYCFGVSYMAAQNSKSVREFVTQMTRQSLC